MANILVVDDMLPSLGFLSAYLKKDGFEVFTATSYKDAVKVLEKNSIDLILMDVMMPEINGIEACKLFKQNPSFVDIPVIFVTSCDTGDMISACFEAGGEDYVHKFSTRRELLIRVKTHLKLRQAQQREYQQLMMFLSALNSFPNCIMAVRPSGRILYRNDAVGRGIEENDSFHEVDSKSAFILGYREFLDSTKTQEQVYLKKLINGRMYEVNCIPVKDADFNEINFYFIVSKDITESYESEEKLRDLDKMKSISRIAGGVAHDLNNLTGAMLSNLSLLEYQGDLNPLQKQILQDVEKAGEKASSVISQLMIYSSHDIPKIEEVCVNKAIEDCVNLLSSSSHTKAVICTDFSAKELFTVCDFRQLEQAIFNLVLRFIEDASGGAKITISTSVVEKLPAQSEPTRFDLQNQEYIKLTIDRSPDKPGLRTWSPVNKDLTRKDAAGLGVAIAEGIVRDMNGALYLGQQGPADVVAYEAYLPLVRTNEQTLFQTQAGAAVLPVIQSILVVDSNDLSKGLLKDFLGLLDYQAEFVNSIEDAIEAYKKTRYSILLYSQSIDHSVYNRLQDEIFSKAKSSKFVALIDEADDDSLRTARELEFNYTLKPIKMKDFSETLKRAK